MIVTLMGRNSINKIILPKVAIGNYWLCDKNDEKEKKLINIEAKDGKWQATSNYYATIINLDEIDLVNNMDYLDSTKKEIKIQNRVDLKEDSIYGVYLGSEKELFIIYCSPVIEEKTYNLKLEDSSSSILIGKGANCKIRYRNNFCSDIHAKMSYEEEKWYIENFDSNFGTFVNDLPVPKEGKKLFNGDVINIIGLKIIVLGKKLIVNSSPNKVSFSKDTFSIYERKYEIIETDEEFEDIEVPSENNYFSRAPRITNVIETEKIKIDSPPQMQSKEETPLILVLGSSLTMGTMMLVSIFNAIDGRISGNASIKQTILSLITATAMLISMVAFPILTVKYDRKRKKRYEEKRQKRYKEYLDKKVENINEIMTKQRKILFENHVSAEQCAEIILEEGSRLWERKREDYDFLSVRLGEGTVPLKIDIQYPEEKFVMEDDNLAETLNEIAKNSKMLKSAPIAISLADKSIAALIVKQESPIESYMKQIIVQLITLHSYEDLKIVFFLKKDRLKKWEYVKLLPHVWENTRAIRFFAEEYDEMEEISQYLEEEMEKRMQYKDKDYKSFMPYYLIITDDYKRIENIKIITKILKNKVNFGFSILCITHNLLALPNECKTFINLEKNSGIIFENEITSTSRQEFEFDNTVNIMFEKIVRTLANIPIKYTATNENMLPNNFTFLEMFDSGKIEQLNILEKWYKNDSTLSLKTPIGINNSGMTIMLDLHEKYHGPHGLIAGSTGSGKSEFIMTYILSLAVNFHPDDVSFILIDYKGGGLTGAFQKENAKLPHIIGTITNIDTNGLQRSLVSIKSELTRRQIIFNELIKMTDEGTIDIYKYQKLYHEGKIKEPMPHLLIICDEFAELKQQQAEFMDELISVSRIGRSLGVHLILATQKPAGIINEQIRSNSKFAICLKVQEKSDSMDVIKKPDATSLKRAGQFYLQVGSDDYCVLGQSGWAGAPYFPTDITEKKVDTSIEFISNTGRVIKQIDDTVQKVIDSQGEQITNIVKYISDISKMQNIKQKKLWLDDIPENIYLADLRKKYKVKEQMNNINPIIGEYDAPENQSQGIVDIQLSKQGNAIIYGSAESGKETLLSTMIYDIITTHDPNEVQLYLLDFGSETLKIYAQCPHVGDVVFINDEEKIDRFFDMIQNEIQGRKNILSNYNGDYNLYTKIENGTMPIITVVINNYIALSEMYKEKYEDVLLTITREGIKYGIVFVMTTNAYSDMRYRLTQNFKQKFALQMNNEDDYFKIFEKRGKKKPSAIFGRGLICREKGEIYEFQTAKISKAEQYNILVSEKIEELKEKYLTSARKIPVMPDIVEFENVEDYLQDITKVPIGISKDILKVYVYDFKRNFINIIASKNLENAVDFANNIYKKLLLLKNLEIAIFDVDEMLQADKTSIKDEYNKFINGLRDKDKKDKLCIIIGVDKFISEYEDVENKFENTLKIAAESRKCNYIFVDNAVKLKNHEYDIWYKNYISKDEGIWVGSGIENQYTITINFERKSIINNCGRNYGYVIKQGNVNLIKLLEMKEEERDE